MGKPSLAKRCTINKHALGDLIACGPIDRVKSVLDESAKTLRRLKVNPRRTKPMPRVPRGVGSWPMMLDVKRWMEGIQPDHEDDVKFLKEVHQAAVARLNL